MLKTTFENNLCIRIVDLKPSSGMDMIWISLVGRVSNAH